MEKETTKIKNIAFCLFLALSAIYFASVSNVAEAKPETKTDDTSLFNPEPTTPYECTKKVCIGELGVREQGGNNRGKRIGEYLAVTKLSEGYAWCAAFVCWTLEQCGIENPKSAWSATVANHNVVYRKGDNFPNTNNKVLVFGLYYKSLKRIGHTGIIIEVRNKDCITIEGNTNGDGSREGDGVHKKIRPTLLNLINEDDQIILLKNGSGRIDNNEGEPIIFFENIEDCIYDLKNM